MKMDTIDKLLESIKELRSAQAETDVQLAKTDAQLAKTDLKLKETARQLSGIGINLGQAAEEFFYYALKEDPRLGDIRFEEVAFNLHSKSKKVEDEFDIVLFNGDTIGIIEVKHKVHPTDLEKLKTKKVGNFRALFPDYAGYKYYLGIGGFSVPAEVADMARVDGIAVLRQKGEVAEIEAENLVAY